ncbi:MAG: hypothetical protein LBS29_01435 [Endomicrobium sp.]|nr:hypothetical protein [Endomicrobium sp.]
MILLVSFSITLVQLLFFREILFIFNGIDFVIGIFVSSIIFSFTLGIYILPYLKLSRNNIKYAFLNTFFLILFSLISFIILQNIRFIFNIPLGSQIPLKYTFISIFFILFPIGFLQSTFLFTLINLYPSSQTVANIKLGGDNKVIHTNKLQNIEFPIRNKNYLQYLFIYIFGFIIASLLYSYLFYTFIGIKILIIVFISLIIVMFCLSNRNTTIWGELLLICLLFAIFLSNWSEKFDNYILHKNFASTKIESYHYTSYGQIAITQKNNEYYFLFNNSLLFSVPDNNIIELEDFGHIPMLHHQDPKDILLIGKILYLPIILKHNIDNVDYIANNNKIIENIKNISSLNTMLNDKRLHIYNENTKKFITYNKNKYDLIFIALETPTNLYVNSFYSKDFFEIVKHSLKNDGFIALQLPGKMVFNSYITTELNQSVIGALKENFKYIEVIPGIKNIIIASQTKIPYRMFIKRHLKKIRGKTLVLTKHHIDERMDTEKTKWLISELKHLNPRNLTNTIWTPHAIVFSVLYDQAKFSPYLSIALDKISQYSYFIIFGVIIIFFQKFLYKTSSFICTSTSCWLNFIIIFILQSYNGQIYKLAGIFLSLFMLGIAVGTFLAKNTLKSMLAKRKILFTEIIFLIMASALFIILKINKVSSGSLYSLLFLSGLALGTELLLLTETSKIYTSKLENIKKMFLSASLGAFTASILCGSFLSLVWGMQNSILFILFLKFLTFCRWADLRKRIL